MKSHIAVSLFILILVLSSYLYAQQDTSDTQTVSTILQLKRQLETFEKKLDSLGAEVRALKQELKSVQNVNTERDTVEQNGEYWLSPSGKRHNKTCRYYGSKNGRKCGPKEGEACKICGG